MLLAYTTLKKEKIRETAGMEIRSSLKWLPRELQESFHLFEDVGDAIFAFKALTTRFLNDINLRISDIYVSLAQSL